MRVEHYFDQSAKVLRIRKALELPVIEGDLANISSTESQCVTPQSEMSAASPASSDNGTSKKLRQPDKKSKVGRPPNAFILYRKHHHPLIVQSQPDLPNCEISKVLGKQWHSEPADVHAEWTALADKIKKQHALENPGYQYAPRKSSEKKRRMTAKKLALQAAKPAGVSFDIALHAAKPAADSFDIDMMDVATFEKPLPAPMAANRPHEVAAFYNTDQQISTNVLLSNERKSTFPSRFKKNYNTDDMSTVFPAGHDNVEHDYNIRAARYEPRDASERITFSSGPYSDVRSYQVATSLAADQFMNDLIDWDGIEADAQLIHNAVDQSNLEVVEFETEADRAQFQQEMNRVLAMFE